MKMNAAKKGYFCRKLTLNMSSNAALNLNVMGLANSPTQGFFNSAFKLDQEPRKSRRSLLCLFHGRIIPAAGACAR